MALVPYLSPEDLEEPDRLLLDPPYNLYRALANSPGGLRAIARFGNWSRTASKLDPRLRELAILSVACTMGNCYEFSHHVKAARGYGVSEEDIRHLLAYLSGNTHELDGLAVATVTGARAIVQEGRMPDVTWHLLRDTLGDGVVVELVIIVSLYTGISRILTALDVELETEFYPYLLGFPGSPNSAGGLSSGSQFSTGPSPSDAAVGEHP
jgi:alkylhydroperoxidase family enzyme